MRVPHQKAKTKYLLAGVMLALGTTLPALADGIPWATQHFDRQGWTEIYGIGQYLHSDDITFNRPIGDQKVKMDDTGLGGFGMAYHFNNYLAIHGDLMFGGATFHGSAPGNDILGNPVNLNYSSDAFIQTGRFNVDWNIIASRLTPFITAGIGYQYTEIEFNRLPQYGYCYWDPWFGYVCWYDHPHAWQTDFTWNAGGGLRWNILDNLVIKATVGATWLEYSGSHGVTTQLEGIFSIGWSF